MTLLEQLRAPSEGWSGDAACVAAEVAAEAANEIEMLRAALELIAYGSGGIPGPRVFAADVLAGRVAILPSPPSGGPLGP